MFGWSRPFRFSIKMAIRGYQGREWKISMRKNWQYFPWLQRRSSSAKCSPSTSRSRMYTFRIFFAGFFRKICELFQSGTAIMIGQTFYSIQIVHLHHWKFSWLFHIIWFWLALDLDLPDLHTFIWLTYFMGQESYVNMLTVSFSV